MQKTLPIFITISPWDAAAKTNTMWALSAVALIVVLLIVKSWLNSKGRKIPSVVWVLIIALVTIPILASTFQIIFKPTPSQDYQVRVYLTNERGQLVNDAEVVSSRGGERKQISGGWQFDIPAANVTGDRKATFTASKPSVFLTGGATIELGSDLRPEVKVQLSRSTDEQIRGMVLDHQRRAITGVKVYVVGRENEFVLTDAEGNFMLATHKAYGEDVMMHAEKPGYQPYHHPHKSGDDETTITLYKE